jgi:uncharacterized iron-regulated membrane protein
MSYTTLQSSALLTPDAPTLDAPVDSQAKSPFAKRPPHVDRTQRRQATFPYRKLFWKWHLYAGLFGAPLMILIALTGAILVFGPEIDRWLRPDLWRIAPPTAAAALESTAIGDQALVDKVRRQFPDSKFYLYRQNKHADEPYQFLLMTPGVRGIHDVWVNPYTGQILGDREREWSVVRIAEQLHRRLLYGETGSTIIEFITGWCIVLTLTGLYLWWPKSWRQLYNGLVPTTRGSAYKVNWRLHSTVGAWTAVVLLLLAVSGMVFSTVTGRMFNIAVAWTGGRKAPAASVRPESGAKDPVSVDTLLARLRSDVPAGTKLTVNFPRDASGSYVISTLRSERAAWDERKGYQSWTFDQYSGQLLDHTAWSDQHPLMKFRQLSLVLHFGSIFGLPTKIIALVACLAVPVLGVTGFFIWWWKRAGKAELAKRPASRDVRPSVETEAPISRWVVAALVLLCLVFPIIGLSFVLVIVFEASRAWWRSRIAPG